MESLCEITSEKVAGKAFLVNKTKKAAREPEGKKISRAESWKIRRCEIPC